MRILIALILFYSFVASVFAWPVPAPSSKFIASQDIIATSSDSHAIGSSSVFWRSTFSRNLYLPERAEAPSVIASFGVVWASTDNHVYFRNDAGTTTRLS